MGNDSKIQEVITHLEKFGERMSPSGGLMEAREPLYRLQELQKEMSASDFFTGLKLGAIKIIRSGNLEALYEIKEINKEVFMDPEVKRAAEKVVEERTARGMEEDKLKALLGL